MKIGDVLKALVTTKSAVLAKEIGIGEKKLRDTLRSVGYEYRNSGDKGWHFVGEGDQPLERDIQDFINVRKTRVQRKGNVQRTVKVSTEDEIYNALTPHEVSALRDMINEWGTIKDAINTVATTRKGVAETSHSINDLYIRVKQEIEPQKKMRKTLNVNEGVGKALDEFAEKFRLDKQDIVELALYDLFAKYGENYKD
ncbi:hypothetical protein CN939_28410 [Bacillus thuringiensis]|nr:hypothetical protein [Bacillus thuringiensis]PEF88432.1 hypothetical protein CON51_05555 [Bacillus thuringiensis]PES55860.1 hypothetical protein CN506_18195 [Bacillus thuringiensis]PFK92623.1 hypothetical protein COJ04_17895 [Bacillus thuringiensis]PFS56335.1 hypothetical protein COK64_20965 [Bacillus thuringiensis]PGL58553.1 hypothetical protein CN939_28410 [Bacillus thuringiensis]